METINITAPLTADDRILTRILRTEKPFNAYQMMREFPSRKWNKWGLFNKKIFATGLSDSLTALRSHHTVGYTERQYAYIRVRFDGGLGVEPP